MKKNTVQIHEYDNQKRMDGWSAENKGRSVIIFNVKIHQFNRTDSVQDL